MSAGSPDTDSPLSRLVHRLASVEPRDAGVISLYLDLAADQHGRDSHDVFLRRAFSDPLQADALGGEAAGVTAAVGRIRRYLAEDVKPSDDAAAIFTAIDGDGFFEGVTLGARLDAHELFVGPVPHVYPLVRLIDQYPRYAALLLDRHRARILVFGLDAAGTVAEVTGEKTRHHSMGGWSQARYQRHTENVHLHHVKEVVETLGRIVRDEGVSRVIVAGDRDLTARLREQMPAALAERLVDALPFDRHAGEDEIVAEALSAFRRRDAADDAERVAEVIDAWHGAGLGVAGPEATLRALQLGQVDELLITGTPATLTPVQSLPDDAAPAPHRVEGGPADADVAQLHFADDLVTRATTSGASVRIIEDPELLRAHGGVAAALRFRL